MSRFRILALFATIAVLAAALAACGGGSSSSSNGEDPQKVVENASLSGVKSANLNLSLHVNASEGGDVTVEASGPFKTTGTESLPELEFALKVDGSNGAKQIHFDGGLTLLSDRAYVAYEGTNYEVDPTTFGFLKSSIEQAQQQGSGGNAASPTACQKAAEGLKLSEFVDNLSNEGNADVEGTSTTKVSGDVNVDGAVNALIKLAQDPSCSAQLEATGQVSVGELETAKSELSGAVKNAHAEVYVGEDNIIRKLVGEVSASGSGGESAEIELEVSLGEVNEEQKISAPSGSTKPLEQLFQKLGVNPLELLEAGSSGQGLGGLLEGLGGSSGGGGGSSSGSGGGSSAGNQAAYLECLQNAKTPVDIQNCASAQ